MVEVRRWIFLDVLTVPSVWHFGKDGRTDVWSTWPLLFREGGAAVGDVLVYGVGLDVLCASEVECELLEHRLDGCRRETGHCVLGDVGNLSELD